MPFFTITSVTNKPCGPPCEPDLDQRLFFRNLWVLQSLQSLCPSSGTAASGKRRTISARWEPAEKQIQREHPSIELLYLFYFQIEIVNYWLEFQCDRGLMIFKFELLACHVRIFTARRQFHSAGLLHPLLSANSKMWKASCQWKLVPEPIMSTLTSCLLMWLRFWCFLLDSAEWQRNSYHMDDYAHNRILYIHIYIPHSSSVD